MREQRVLEILKIIRKDGVVTTRDLAERMDVSLSTIRRDLAELTQRNLVAVSQNVVVPISETTMDGPLSYRTNVNANAKLSIAREAVKLVKNGDTVFLDSSTTVLAMVNLLNPLRNLTVVTNGLLVLPRLQNNSFNIHVIGGEISNLSHGFYGPVAEQTLKSFNFDLAFFSPVAVTPDNFAAETTHDAATIRRAAMAQSLHSALLFDHTKIGMRRSFNFARLDDFQYLITDDERHGFETSAVVRRVKS